MKNNVHWNYRYPFLFICLLWLKFALYILCFLPGLFIALVHLGSSFILGWLEKSWKPLAQTRLALEGARRYRQQRKAQEAG